MIKRIELVNFMSHKRTVIEPAAGLTVLIGPNNVGKSAIIAALQILCYNDNSTYVMRHGEKQCSVTIETDDGHTIIWKRKKSPSYEIDGEDFSRLRQGGVPDELHQVLRLSKVEGNANEQFDVHFGSQKTPIFLLDSSGSTAARFFASSSDASRLIQMQQRHNEKQRDQRKERVRLEQESTLLNAELAALEPVSELERRCKHLEQQFHAIGEARKQLDELKQLEVAMAEQQQIVDLLQMEVATLKHLTPSPTLESTEPLDSLIDDITATTARHKHITQQQSTLVPLASPPELVDTTALAQLIEQRESLERDKCFTSVQTKQLKSLAEPPALAPTEHLSDLITQLKGAVLNDDRLTRHHELLQPIVPLETEETSSLRDSLEELEAATAQFSSAQSRLAATSRLGEPPAIDQTTQVHEFLAKFDDARRAFGESQAELEEVTFNWQQMAKSLREAAQNETCPTCGEPINVDKLLRRSELEGATNG